MEQGLRSISASKLDKFIEDHLPDTSFRANLREVIEVLCEVLKDRSFPISSRPVRGSKVVKGGSSGKGTTLKGRSDADLVVFLNNLTSFEDRLKLQVEFLKEIKKQLCEIQHERHFGVKYEIHSLWSPNSGALSFKLSAPYLLKEVKFDFLPAFDVLDPEPENKPTRERPPRSLSDWSISSSIWHLSIPKRPNQQFYANLISERTSLGKDGEFSPCFPELRQYFLNWRPPKLKSLIRLVKHWYQQCNEKLGDPLPPQYALELLTVYAWERGSRVTKFNTAQGFRTVLELVIKYKQLQIYWTVFCDFLHPEVSNYLSRQLRKARPVILDPADPRQNVAGSNPKGWRRLAGEAAAWLLYPCFKYRDGSSVCSWDVPMEVDVPKQENHSFCVLYLFFLFLFLFIFWRASYV